MIVSGELVLKIINIKNLKTSLFDKPDPYIKIQYDNETRMTKEIKDCKDPVFNEKF